MAKSKTIAAVEAGISELATIDAKCKVLFDKRDALETSLINQIQRSRGGEIRLPNDRILTLKDNFLDRDGLPRNVAFKTAAVKRFEIMIR
jgi:hypothetical protein